MKLFQTSMVLLSMALLLNGRLIQPNLQACSAMINVQQEFDKGVGTLVVNGSQVLESAESVEKLKSYLKKLNKQIKKQNRPRFG